MTIQKENNSGLKTILENGLGYISSIISEKMYPRRDENTETFMKNIDNTVLTIEKRVLRKILSFIVIGVGTLFLLFALFSYVKESLGWSNSLAYLSLGIIILIIGLILKLNENEGIKNDQ